mgnify:CR=1 FL=1
MPEEVPSAANADAYNEKNDMEELERMVMPQVLGYMKQHALYRFGSDYDE